MEQLPISNTIQFSVLCVPSLTSSGFGRRMHMQLRFYLFILQTCQFHYWMLCSFLRLLPEVEMLPEYFLLYVKKDSVSTFEQGPKTGYKYSFTFCLSLHSLCHTHSSGNATSRLTLHKHCPLWLITGSHFLCFVIFKSSSPTKLLMSRPLV